VGAREAEVCELKPVRELSWFLQNPCTPPAENQAGFGEAGMYTSVAPNNSHRKWLI